MNREKMIEALAKAIYCAEGSGRLPAPWTCAGDVHEKEWAFLRKEYAKSAAAVLDLCGPKKLVWKYQSDGSVHDVDCRYEVAPDGKYWRLVEGVTGGGSYIGHFADRTAAQAAAKSHADAAHWANTPLGHALGLEEDFPTKNQTQAPIRIKLRSWTYNG